jgi:hypothetical protein
MALYSSSYPSTPSRSLYPGKEPLRTGYENQVKVFLTIPDPHSDPRVRVPPHPFGLRRWRHVGAIVICIEFSMQSCKAMVSMVHAPASLDLISEAVTVPTGEEPTRTVELRNLPAAMHSVGADIADEPRSLPAEAAGCPPDRHTLFNLLPVLLLRLDAVHQGNCIPASHDAYRSSSVTSVGPLPAAKL